MNRFAIFDIQIPKDRQGNYFYRPSEGGEILLYLHDDRLNKTGSDREFVIFLGEKHFQRYNMNMVELFWNGKVIYTEEPFFRKNINKRKIIGNNSGEK